MATPEPAQQIPRQRRRVRVAEAVLRRVHDQREQFATEYGKATTVQQRFAATFDALRAAAAPGPHQSDPGLVERRLTRLIDEMKDFLDELHEAQEAQANRTIRADQRRIARNERRRGYAGRSPTHPQPTPTDPDAAAGPAA